MKHFLAILFLVITPGIYSQSLRKDLVAVRWPDLTNLEKSVREQVTALQNSLASASKNPATSETALAEAYGKLGQVYHAYSLVEPAHDCYLNASLLAPTDFRWTYLAAKLDQQAGRFEDAIRRYRIARSLRLDYVAAPVNLGNIFLELNRLEEAGASFNAALEIDKNNAAAHYGLGQIALSNRSYAEAIRRFEATLVQVPGANRVHYSLAMAYRGLGDLEKVKVHLAQQGSVGVRVADPLVDALQDLIEGERLPLARGKVAFEAKRYAEAAEEFRKAVAAKPDSVIARINLGVALSQIGDVQGAAEEFEEAIRIEPGRVNAHYNLAILLAGQNKHEQAIAHLQSALAVEPNDTNVRFLLGSELVKVGRLDDAFKEAKLLHRKGQFKQALEILEKCYAQDPQSDRTAVLLAFLLATSPELELRNGARALELAQRVYNVTTSPQHGAVVALALAELGRCREASDWQRRMITAAEQQNNPDLSNKLRVTLKLFEQSPCRPPADTSFENQ